MLTGYMDVFNNYKYMGFKKAVCIIFSAIFVVKLWAGEIEGAFLERLESFPPDTFVSSLIFLKAQLNAKAVEKDLLTPTRRPFRERHSVIVNLLKENAENTQREILGQLSRLKSLGYVKSYRSFWISNVITLTAKPEVLYMLADRNDVAVIYENFPIRLIENLNPRKSGPKSKNVEGGIQDINAPLLWAKGITGSNRIIAIFDTGVDGDHPALHERWRGLEPGVSWEEAWLDLLDSTTYPIDEAGHGTSSAGCALGRAESDTIGVAPDASWIAARIFPAGTQALIENAIEAFQWAADPDGDPNTVEDVPDVCTNSWGIFPFAMNPCDTLFWNFIDNCEAAGVAVIFGAGNEGGYGASTLRIPATIAKSPYSVFSVGALDVGSEALADFSSRGPTPCAGVPIDNLAKPEVCARGVKVRTSTTGGGYVVVNGTSLSCPYVAGAVALLRQVNPDATVDEIKRALFYTAVDLGDPGDDNSYGMGRVDVYAAAKILSGSKIEGHIYDSTTVEPLENVRIEIMGEKPLITDSSGYYQIYLVGGTTVEVIASLTGYKPDTQSTYLPVDTVVTMDFYLQPVDSGILQGFVYSYCDSLPVEGAVIYARDLSCVVDTSDSDGFFELRLPGQISYQVVSRAEGFSDEAFTVFIPENDVMQRNIYLYETEDFEDSDGEFVGDGDWEWGISSSGPNCAYSGEHVWATNLDGSYGSNLDCYLYSREYTIMSLPARLSFYQWYYFVYMDGGNISISTDGGKAWDLIVPEGGYPADRVDVLDGEPGFSGMGLEWKKVTFDLTHYLGQTVQFRWRFGSDGSAEQAGWYIDDVTVSGSCEGQIGPKIWLSPPSFEVFINQGDIVEEMLNIGNKGKGNLYFKMLISPDNSVGFANTPFQWNVFEYDGPYEGREMGIESPFYEWIDSDSATGPVFDWVDITEIGTPINLSDDDYETISLPWKYIFFDSPKNTIRISSNGYVTFGVDAVDPINGEIPFFSDPNDCIYTFWDDLNPSMGGGVYCFYDDVDERFIIEWHQIPHNYADGVYTFELILYPGGSAVLQYLEVDGELGSATIGIEDSTGSRGFQIAYNQQYLHDSLAIRIQPHWLQFRPDCGVIPPDSVTAVSVRFDASYLMPGNYEEYIEVLSGDLGHSHIYVPVILHVSPSPVCGDANGDQKVDLVDVVYLANYLYNGGPEPISPLDPNQSGEWDVSDLVYLANYLFAGGPAPCEGIEGNRLVK